MTIHISKRVLYSALTKVRCVRNKGEAVLLQKKTDMPLKIRMFSGDGEFFELEESAARGEGEVVLPARKLQMIVKPSSKKDDRFVLIEATGKGVTRLVVDDLETRFEVSAEIPSIPKSEFKRVLQYFAKKFFDHLTYVLPAMSKDEEKERLYCLGVLDGQVVATDGHRIHCDTLSAELKESVVIRAPAAKILHKLLTGEKGKLTIAQSKKYIRFVVTREDSKWTFVCKKTGMNFPLYREAIPAMDAYVVADVDSVKKVLERTKVVMDGNSNSVELEVVDKDFIFKDGGFGNCLTKVKILSRVGEGGKARWIDIRYFLDALKVDDDRVKISMGEVHEPLVLDFGDRMALIMPRRDR